MSWENVLKNDLKNQIDEYDRTQRKDGGPLIIYLSNKVGPHPEASRIFFVNNEQQFNELKQLYSQTNTVKDKGDDAFFVMDN